MKDFVILVLAALIFFFVWNSRQTKVTYAAGDVQLDAPVPPLVVQAIIEKFQSTKPDYVPIDTVFVNLQPDGSYMSRIMFYNTKEFFGTQYDIKAKVASDGSVTLLDVGDSATVDPTYGYKPDKYQPWVDVQKNLDTQFKGALQGYKNQPPQPNLSNPSIAYQQGMLESTTNLMTRS
jgi:hypothetical protein